MEHGSRSRNASSSRITVEPEVAPLALWFGRRRQTLSDIVPGGTCLHFALGRVALLWLCQHKHWGPGDAVLLPSFVCGSIVRPFVQSGVTPVFYAVHADLSVDLNDIEAKMGPNIRGGLIVHYFGWPQPRDVRAWLANRDPKYGLWIEDLAHALLSEHHDDGPALGTGGDVVLTSYRKLIPCPDGSTLAFRDSQHLSGLGSSQVGYQVHALARGAAMISQGILDRSRAVHAFSARLQGMAKQWRGRGTIGFGNMAWSSRRLVERFDMDHAARVRRDNAQRLIAGLKSVPSIRPMCDELAPGVVPMCVPVLVQERARVQQALMARGILSLHLWPRPAELPRDHSPSIAEIQENILCLPVADCYGADDMERIVRALRETA